MSRSVGFSSGFFVKLFILSLASGKAMKSESVGRSVGFLAGFFVNYKIVTVNSNTIR